MDKKETALLIGLIFTIAASLWAECIVSAEEIKQNTLRLHVIANSDSDTDVRNKLMIKDEILKMEDLLPFEADNFTEAEKITEENLDDLEERINGILKQNNIDYGAKCTVENFYFDTIQYVGFALPQGEYTALTVRLGKAEGKNWWCVMYPALCSQSFGESALEESEEFIKTEKITPRFKAVEIYEKFKNKIFDNKAKEYTHGE